MTATRPWYEDLAQAAPSVFGPVEPAFRRLLQDYSHLARVEDERGRKHWIAFREDARLDAWAEISLLVDFIYPNADRDRAVGSDDPGLVVLHYVAWNPSPIDPERWRRRYPDVPFDLAVVFVMHHEIGHAIRGRAEDRADAYARGALGLPANPESTNSGGGPCLGLEASGRRPRRKGGRSDGGVGGA